MYISEKREWKTKEYKENQQYKEKATMLSLDSWHCCLCFITDHSRSVIASSCYLTHRSSLRFAKRKRKHTENDKQTARSKNRFNALKNRTLNKLEIKKSRIQNINTLHSKETEMNVKAHFTNLQLYQFYVSP